MRAYINARTCQNARFMRFGRKDKSKKEKKTDRLSTSPSDRTLSGHMPLEKKSEDEKRSTWSRVGWGRIASERRNSKPEPPGGSGDHLVVPRSASSGFSIPDDVMQSKLEAMPDIFFQPLVDFPNGASVCPLYIEGPDHAETEFLIRDSSSIVIAGSSTSSVPTVEETNARACGRSVSTYPRMTASTSNNVVRLGMSKCLSRNLVSYLTSTHCYQAIQFVIALRFVCTKMEPSFAFAMDADGAAYRLKQRTPFDLFL